MEKTFSLYGKEVELTEGQVNFNEIMLMLKEQEKNVEEEFEEQYYSSFSNMDEVMAGIDDFVWDYVNRVIKVIIQYLSEKNVYSYDSGRFWSLAGDNGHYERLIKIMSDVEEQYIAILDNQEEAAEYRRQRKASRGRWEGGGFGIEGAVKGAALAGTANIASGLAHSTVNAVGNMVSAIDASRKKSKMYKDKQILSSYIAALKYTYELFALDVSMILREETDIKVESPCEENELSAVINNMKQGYIKEKEIILEKCIEVIKTDPYYTSAYLILLEHFEDPNGELEELERYFGSTNVKDYKENEIVRKLSNINYYSIEDISNREEKFIQWASRYNVSYDNYVACLDKVKAELDKKMRTIDGNIYDTVDLAKENEERIKALVAKIAETNGNDKEKIEGIIKEFEESNILSKEKYIMQLKKELHDEDIRFRTVKKSIYSSREEAVVARREAEQIDECLKKICSLDEATEIKDKVADMNTSDLKTLYMDYLDECVSVLVQQDEEHIKSYQDRILHSTSRKELAECFYEAQKWIFIGNMLNVSDEKYYTWYSDFRNTYLNVNGKTLKSPIEADKAYLNYVEHGRDYLKYITEKNTKKSFFSQLKSSVTGLVYKNYEVEYNILTENGTKPLPQDTMEDFEKIEMIETKEQQGYTEYKNKISKKFERIQVSNEIKDKELDVSKLVYQTNPVTKEEIEKIMKDCCPMIQVGEAEKTN